MLSDLLKNFSNENPSKLLKTILNETAKNLSKTFKRDIFIFVHEPPRDLLKLLGASKKCEAVEKFKIYFSDNKGLYENLFNKEIYKMTVEDFEELKCLNTNELYLIPIVLNNSLIGAFGLPNKFDEKELKKFIDETESYGIILKLTMEFLVLEETRDRLEYIEEITDLFENILDENILVRKIIETIKNMLHAQGVLLWKIEGNKLILKESLGFSSNEISKNILNEEDSLEGLCKKNKKPFLVVGKKRFEKFKVPLQTEILSALYAPITIDNVEYGVVSVYNRKEGFGFRPYKHFDNFDLSSLRNITRRLGLALSRIYLYDKLKDEIEKLITLKKNHENLIKIQREHLDKLNSLHKISQAVRSTFDKINAIKIMLMGLTSVRGLKFNRALYLERDRTRGVLVPKIWVGPSDDENVENIWKEANKRALRYGDIVQYLREEAIQLPSNNKLTQSVRNKLIVYKGQTILERAVTKKHIIHVVPQMIKLKSDELQYLYELIKYDEFVIIPITGKWETKGVVIADNKFTGKEITSVDIEILRLFQDSIGLSIETIENYEELKEKTKSLEEQKNLIDFYRRFNENILQNLAVAVIVIDRKGKILEWNKKAELFFDKSREQIVGESTEILKEKLGIDVINSIESIFFTREEMKMPKYIIQQGYEEKVFDIQLAPLWNRDLDVIEGVIVTFDEVTETYKMEKEIARREKLAAIGEMTARVAHEIKNPLTIIGGFVNRMMKKLDQPEKIKQYSQIIMDELSHLESIVSEILEFSRGSRIPMFESVDLNSMISEIILMYQDFFHQKDLELKFEKMFDKIEVKCDRSRVKQVLINLIKNAIEATNEKNYVYIKTGIENEYVFFQIENNGKPIPEDEQNKIFSPFFTTKVQGTGLGLPICKKIIEEEHKGKLYLVKSDERSTIFRFELPLN
ncbi:PAS/PAC sensor signal transduction histidine kinase [Marinitoga hydrogenitolerans DSM 16785]|uniref:histidine kinase n=1 Tax=Marinitoga hydrogenitolerans (strain DSM 16785 / JCM 12826 / AT1271) TaxID=1122195 RepID=A0A1M4WJC7_MARH1|nr:ATP-binding protein [Marinitoga hydrogenitolerans]SHE81391.1 PAS/PAC sensor signal transduction histidine kinase [Marinitoga hydrogenitolerans DSM 16785]